jgi:hypothetical protein
VPRQRFRGAGRPDDVAAFAQGAWLVLREVETHANRAPEAKKRGCSARVRGRGFSPPPRLAGISYASSRRAGGRASAENVSGAL